MTEQKQEDRTEIVRRIREIYQSQDLSEEEKDRRIAELLPRVAGDGTADRKAKWGCVAIFFAGTLFLVLLWWVLASLTKVLR